MTSNSSLWQALQAYLPKRTWLPFSDILATVRTRIILDEEDLARRGSLRGMPQWEANLRRLLRAKKQAGNIRARRRTVG
jgi:hypothetical protein